MLEREMEDLIAMNPEHFFPRLGFVLLGRQQSFRGVGRFDLLFSDRHGMTILMELKAVPARYDVIDQVARYRDELVALGSTNVLMWIVAPSIPPGLKEFLSHLGIEYTEIHETEIKRAALLFGYSLRGSQPEQVATVPPIPEPSTFKQPPAPLIYVPTKDETQHAGPGQIDDWGFGKATQPSYLIRVLEIGGQTKEEIRSAYIAHFHPQLSYSDAKGISGFNVFFPDSKDLLAPITPPVPY